MKLIGISCRTSNAIEFDPKQQKIPTMIQKYFEIARTIPHVSDTKKTFCVYTEYQNDLNGEYTYFIGSEVASFDGVDNSVFKTLIIPEQQYIKFTSEKGQMPDICIKLWKKIWSDIDLNAKRAYVADFEVYDERSFDTNNAELDIYIGVQN